VATLKDVAALAGVDKSTASRVLRNQWSEVVRPETRDRIHEAAAQLGYRPNAFAKSLRTRRTNTLALVVPDLDNLGFANVSHGVQAAAATRHVLVSTPLKSQKSSATARRRSGDSSLPACSQALRTEPR